MGYMLSSFGELPIEEDVTLYIFVIDVNWKGGVMQSIEENFALLAQRIGPKAVIAKGFQESLWSEEICYKYLGVDYDKLIESLPALLVTDSHPDQISEESLRLFIPLDRAEKKYASIASFFSALTDFAHNRDADFLNKFHDVSALDRALNIIDLKPNFFGLGVNVNALIKRLRR